MWTATICPSSISTVASAGMMKPYYEAQTPYQVPIKAGFVYLKAITKFRENPELNHASAIALLDEALAMVPRLI